MLKYECKINQTLVWCFRKQPLLNRHKSSFMKTHGNCRYLLPWQKPIKQLKFLSPMPMHPRKIGKKNLNLIKCLLIF